MRFGRPVAKPVGDVTPLPDPATVADFDLGTWRVRPALSRMTRADRLVALEPATLRCLLALHDAPPEGVARSMLTARVFGQGVPDERLRRCLSHLRRVFAEDGSVRIENAPGDRFSLWTGPPVPGRRLRGGDGHQLSEPVNAVSAWIERPRNRVGGAVAAVALVGALIFGLMHMLGGTGHALSNTVRSVRPFATEPGIKTSPSFAPDGRQVVYSWAQPGATAHLYLRSVTGGAPRPITSGDGDDVHPVWSNGGGLIAFARLHDGACDLMTVLADGTNLRRVGSCAPDVIGPMTFSRDGRALTYPNHTAPILPSQIVTLDLNTGALSGVTNPVVGMPGDTLPTLSTNARRLAFVRTRSPGIADVLLLEHSGGEGQRLTRDAAPIAGMAWEPGARTLLVASARSGRSAFWAVPVDNGSLRYVLGGTGELGAPTFSPDAHELVFERATRTTQLSLASISDAAAPPLAVGDGTDSRSGPALSPDGRQVAFVSDRSGNDELWVGGTDGSNAHQLTHEKSEWVGTPVWSHDGRALVIAAGSRGETDLYVVDAASGARRALTHDHASSHPAFARDGAHLYFASRSDGVGPAQLHRRSWPSFADDVQVTTEGALSACESGDGKHLYFTRPDRGGLWSRGLDPDADETLLTPDLSAAESGNWACATGGAYFVGVESGAEPALYFYGEDTEAVRRIRTLPRAAANAGLALASDGRTLLYVEQTALTVDLDIAQIE